MVDEMRAHVAERALTPVDPATPIERMVERVVLDVGRRAEEQIPVQALRQVRFDFVREGVRERAA